MDSLLCAEIVTTTASQTDYLIDLNPPQREAVTHFEGPILVLAGAGSGKTRVLTRRVAHLVLAHGVRPDQILAVTFTNKATEEMRERLLHLLGTGAKDLWVATFHSASLRLLRRHARELGFTSDFVVYDDQDTKSLLKQALKEHGIDEKRTPASHFGRLIDDAKNNLITPDDYVRWRMKSARSAQWNFEREVREEGEVYAWYQKALQRANAMDFGDLVMNAVFLLEGVKAVREWYQGQLRFVLVDEFQDTNLAQYRFIKVLTARYRNLLVVGDDDQSIYAFRGASIEHILNFEKDFPETKIVTLEQNYRSAGNILEAAYHVIRHNAARREKKLWTDAEAGLPIKVFVAPSEFEEAQFVAERILEIRQSGTPFSSVAVFYRTNAQSRALEEAFLEARIPYRIFGGLKFYERKEVKDILAYLRLVINPNDNQAFLRVINTPTRGVGAQTVQTLVRRAQSDKTALLEAARSSDQKGVRAFVEIIDRLVEKSNQIFPSELIHQVMESTQYLKKLKDTPELPAESRAENLQELAALAQTLESSGTSEGNGTSPREALQSFLDRVSLSSATDSPTEGGDQSENSGSVSMMTLHLAKGLEFPFVFFTGLEEGLIPHYRSLDDAIGLAEERRLCYVGITRAMKQLYLTRAIRRGMFASGELYGGAFRSRSRFLDDIPSQIVDEEMFSWDNGDPLEYA